jgi:hypothetical protein
MPPSVSAWPASRCAADDRLPIVSGFLLASEAMRALAAMALLVGCASAGTPRIGGDDTSGDDAPPVDAPPLPPDACPDTDTDTVCNNVDKCPGFNDAVDADADTVADGCDKCPGVDDRPDVNMNSTPDCVEYMTRTIPLKVVGTNLWRGWYASNTAHSSANDNTLTGELSAGFYNSYFVFPLTGFTATSVQTVTLQLTLEAYTADATETFSVWDVSTPSTTVENSTTDVNIYNDLMMGTQYATSTATAAQVGTLLTIPLNAMAAVHATQKIGNDFVVGVHVDTTPGWIRFGNAGATTIQIVVKYLP